MFKYIPCRNENVWMTIATDMQDGKQLRRSPHTGDVLWKYIYNIVSVLAYVVLGLA